MDNDIKSLDDFKRESEERQRKMRAVIDNAEFVDPSAESRKSGLIIAIFSALCTLIGTS